MGNLKGYNRRKFIAKGLSLVTLVFSSVLVKSCQSKKQDESEKVPVSDCGDYSQLTEEEVAKRMSLGYLPETPIEENKCNNCQLYLPPKEGEKCGGCQLFKGPVFPEAYCTYWAPQV